jgi:hypothetical protein
MDGLLGIIIFILFIYYVHKSAKRERQEKKRIAKEERQNYMISEAKHRDEKRKADLAEMLREQKKERIRKQKEEVDQAILEAKEQRRIREKLKPIQEESILKQKNAMEETDQEVVINWHKAIIKKCQNYETNHSNFLADYKNSKISQVFLDNYIPFDFEEYVDVWHMSQEWFTERNLFLIKLKNTIDGKLYLVFGSTDSIPVEKAFIDDPVVELMEVVTSVSINKNVALVLEECLLHHFKPEGTFDPFAKFDGYEGVIELRYLNQASKMIDDFKENQKVVILAMENLEIMEFNELNEIYENYHLNDLEFNNYYVDHIANKMPIRKKDFLNSLYKLYDENALFLDEVNSHYEGELNEMNRSYPLWLQKQIDVMEDHVYKTLDTYTTTTTWRRGMYFSQNHPFGLNFDAKAPIILLLSRGKIDYKRMFSGLLF